MGSINHFWKSFAAQAGLSLISSLIKPIWIWTGKQWDQLLSECVTQSSWKNIHPHVRTNSQNLRGGWWDFNTLGTWLKQKDRGIQKVSSNHCDESHFFLLQKKIYHVWPSNDLKNKTWCQEYRQITGKLNSLSFGIQIWESVCEKTYKYRINSSPCHEPWTPHH